MNSLKITARIDPVEYKALKIKLLQEDTNFSRWLREKIKLEIKE